MTTEQALKRCIFCGQAGKVSREHMVPYWMQSPAASGNNSLYIRESGGPDHPQWRDERRGRARDLVAKAPCKACNSGWMNDLDTDLEVLGRQLMNGKAVRLTKGKQQALATWAAKFVMMLQLIYPRDGRFVIPESDYARFYAARRPSDDMALWAAYMEPPGKRGGPVLAFEEHRHDELFYDAALLASMGLDPALECQGYSATVRFGHCVIGLLRVGSPELLAAHSLGSPRYWVQIWPAVGTRAWPPPLRMRSAVGLDPLVAGLRAS